MAAAVAKREPLPMVNLIDHMVTSRNPAFIPPLYPIRSAITAYAANGKLQPQMYEPYELTALILQNTKSSILRHLTTDEVRFLHLLPLITNPTTDEEVLMLLDVGFAIFNKAFFFSSLHDQIHLLDTFRGTCRCGCKDFTGSRGVFTYRDRGIHINLASHLMREGRGTHRQQYLAVLLHEMTHAFLTIYSCKCLSCWPSFKNRVGNHGHGPSWCDSMSAIKQAVERDLGWYTEFGIADSLQMEILDGFKPTYEQLVRWGLAWGHCDTTKVQAENNTPPDRTASGMSQVHLHFSRTPRLPFPQ
jgi:SprT-like family